MSTKISTMNSWILAFRPKTLTAGVIPIWVASSLAYSKGSIENVWIPFCALGASIFIQIATNLFNDAIDFKKGADTSDRLGPVRVTQSGLLTSKQVYAMAVFCIILAAAIAVPLIVQGGVPFLVLTVVSCLLAYGYTGGPFPLAYLGLGDLFVILFFGVIAVTGVTYLIQSEVSLPALIAGTQIGFLATVLIAINNLRDIKGDSEVGKRTLAVRFGESFSKFEISLLLIAPQILGGFWITQDRPWAFALPLLLLVPMFKLILTVKKTAPGAVYNSFLGKAAMIHMFFGVLLGIGLWL